MQTTFDAVVLGFGNNTGIEVPFENLSALDAGKRPAVIVRVREYSYESTVGSMAGRAMISLSKAHREAAGLAVGDAVTVTLELHEGPREVDVPPPLVSALAAAGLTHRFADLPYSRRKEFARQVAEAKADATRDRRIDKVLHTLT